MKSDPLVHRKEENKVPQRPHFKAKAVQCSIHYHFLSHALSQSADLNAHYLIISRDLKLLHVTAGERKRDETLGKKGRISFARTARTQAFPTEAETKTELKYSQ